MDDKIFGDLIRYFQKRKDKATLKKLKLARDSLHTQIYQEFKYSHAKRSIFNKASFINANTDLFTSKKHSKTR